MSSYHLLGVYYYSSMLQTNASRKSKTSSSFKILTNTNIWFSPLVMLSFDKFQICKKHSRSDLFLLMLLWIRSKSKKANHLLWSKTV